MIEVERKRSTDGRGALRRLASRLARIDPDLTDVALRRKSRLLAICLLGMTVLFALVDTTLLSLVPGYRPPWPGYIFLVGTYLLNRRGDYQLASALVAAMFPIVVFGQIILGTSANPVMSLGFLSLSPLLGAILLSSTGVALLASVNVAGVALVRVMLPERLSLGESIGPLAEMAISGVLAVAYMRHRDQIEADRQRQLKESEERLRMALEAAKMGSWEWSIKDDRTLVTPGLEKIFGLTEGAFGNGFAAYFSRVEPEDQAHVRLQVERVLAGPSSELALSHRIVLPGKAVRWVEVNGRLQRDEAGRAWRLTGTVVDVSERRSLEEQLRQAQKLEAVGRLAGGIAHDFNNLLTVIMGNVELLATEDPPPELAEIQHAALSAGNLTRQLLAFSRQAVLRPEVLNLNAVLVTTSTMLRRIIGEDIELAVIQEPDLFNSRVDAAQIQEILLNLATNARDAMPEGGKLVFRTANVLAGSTALPHDLAPQDHVLLLISDTGHGMDAPTLARVFEPFFTTKPVGKGTGLGMAMVFGIVAQSGGHIQVESREGQGTTFRLYFPKADLPTDGDRRSSQPIRGGSETILLVEDEDAVRRLCQRLLEREGYTVLVARSAAEGEALWRDSKQRVDLVLSDVVMPGGSGRALAALLHAERPELPVILMSGYAQGTESDAGADEADILQKPFEREVLLGRVRGALDARSRSKALV